ncbi:Crossover junction endonuclease mus81 [Malassezia sp. CBS 17886]|nr:Crossover junction endonuclease mus81 [Malassezia sp. CBS 17886]
MADSDAKDRRGIWLSLLQKLGEQAQSKGLKSASAYNKAHRSLQQSTDAFTHPCETVRLHGIGDSIAKRLEAEYAAWITYPNHDRPYCNSDYLVAGSGARFSAPSSLSQSHAQSSQSMRPARRSHISAWNGMKTLIEKGYIFRFGNPPLFSLSDRGRSVARLLVEAEGLMPPALEGSGRDRGLDAPPPVADTCAAQSDELPGPTDRQHTPGLHTDSPKRAAASKNLYLPPRNSADDDTTGPVTVDLCSEGGVECVDGVEASSNSSEFIISEVQMADRSTDETATLAAITTPGAQSAPSTQRIFVSLIDSSPIVSSSPSSSRAQRRTPFRSDPAPPHAASTPWGTHAGEGGQPTRWHVLPAGSFTIHMVMDHREVRAAAAPSTGDASRRVTFEDAIRQRGVACELRPLELSDVLWVARVKQDVKSRIAEQWRPVQEVVLDTVVERKRLDDLVSSILDGRWHDQKHRLHRASLGRVVYLIEDVDVANLVQRYGKQIQTALSSTQVIDGFMVHRSANQECTADFLVSMQRRLEEMYEGRPLHVLRDDTISESSFPELQQHLSTMYPGTPFHTTFQTFQALNGKSTHGAYELHATWVKMLQCIRGVSLEKALEIARCWTTPRGLVDAYRREDTTRECAGHGSEARDGARLVCDTLDADAFVDRRRIGPAVSRRIWQVLRADAYDA